MCSSHHRFPSTLYSEAYCEFWKKIELTPVKPRGYGEYEVI
jgi:hypothetical protein